jgi:hypothetical protein
MGEVLFVNSFWADDATPIHGRVLPHEKIPANRVASSDGEHIAIPSGTPRSDFLPHFPNPFFIAIATP